MSCLQEQPFELRNQKSAECLQSGYSADFRIAEQSLFENKWRIAEQSLFENKWRIAEQSLFENKWRIAEQSQFENKQKIAEQSLFENKWRIAEQSLFENKWRIAEQSLFDQFKGINMIKSLFQKYRQLIFYGIFGVLTTVVNIIVYYICAHLLHIPTVPSTIIAWILSVLFAYVTNRKWVFSSEVSDLKGILKEIGSFFFFRLATGVLDVIIMHIFVDVLGWNDVLVKVFSNIIVIILNFLASKLVVFKNKK